jgi:hypothetical protein
MTWLPDHFEARTRFHHPPVTSLCICSLILSFTKRSGFCAAVTKSSLLSPIPTHRTKSQNLAASLTAAILSLSSKLSATTSLSDILQLASPSNASGMPPWTVAVLESDEKSGIDHPSASRKALLPSATGITALRTRNADFQQRDPLSSCCGAQRWHGPHHAGIRSSGMALPSSSTHLHTWAAVGNLWGKAVGAGEKMNKNTLLPSHARTRESNHVAAMCPSASCFA